MRGLVLVALMLAACGDSESTPDAATPPDAAEIADASAPPDHEPASEDAQPPPPTGHCRDMADCPSPNDLCYGPNQPGCPLPPREECTQDGSCATGMVCHSFADFCSPDGVGSQCAPECQDADACDPGFDCVSNHCRPKLCGAGYTCPPSQTCDPSTVHADAPPADITHGCVLIACAADGACPGGTRCVNQICQDDFGMCMPPVP